jgi:hypothetical protein
MFGIIARRASKAVLFRRGPSKWCQLILWHTDTDKIERGQWVKHRIEERWCDLSPDGKLLVYSARDGRQSRKHEKRHEKWTAVSVPPYFTALALWPVAGLGYSVGFFESDRDLVIHGFTGDAAKEFSRIPLKVQGSKPLWAQLTRTELPPSFGIEVLHRIKHYGWQYNKDSGFLERESKRGRWRLCWKREYAVSLSGEPVRLEGADWADIDHRDRLVFTRRGKLFAAKVTTKGMEEKELADFNADRPDPTPPPAAAKRWPR